MKLTLFSTLCLAFTALAAPLPAPIPAPAALTIQALETQMSKLEVTILDVINDIDQGGSSMHTDYHSGLEQFKKLIPGPKPCGSLPARQAKSESQTTSALLASRQALLDLTDTLATEASTTASTETTIRTDLCKAYSQYLAAHPYIKSL